MLTNSIATFRMKTVVPYRSAPIKRSNTRHDSWLKKIHRASKYVSFVYCVWVNISILDHLHFSIFVDNKGFLIVLCYLRSMPPSCHHHSLYPKRSIRPSHCLSNLPCIGPPLGHIPTCLLCLVLFFLNSPSPSRLWPPACLQPSNLVLSGSHYQPLFWLHDLTNSTCLLLVHNDFKIILDNEIAFSKLAKETFEFLFFWLFLLCWGLFCITSLHFVRLNFIAMTFFFDKS